MIEVEELKIFNLFTGLDESELEKIAGLCTRYFFEKNALIFDPHSSTSDIFLLEGGNDIVQIEVPLSEYDHEKKLVIHTLSKGETFGWAPLVPSHLRTALARCLERVDIIRINGRELIELLDRNYHMGYVIMKNLSGIISTRLAYTTVILRREIQRSSPRVISRS